MVLLELKENTLIDPQRIWSIEVYKATFHCTKINVKGLSLSNVIKGHLRSNLANVFPFFLFKPDENIASLLISLGGLSLYYFHTCAMDFILFHFLSVLVL